MALVSFGQALKKLGSGEMGVMRLTMNHTVVIDPAGHPVDLTHVKEACAERHDRDEEGRYEVGHHLGEELPPHRYLHLDALLAWLPDGKI